MKVFLSACLCIINIILWSFYKGFVVVLESEATTNQLDATTSEYALSKWIATGGIESILSIITVISVLIIIYMFAVPLVKNYLQRGR